MLVRQVSQWSSREFNCYVEHVYKDEMLHEERRRTDAYHSYKVFQEIYFNRTTEGSLSFSTKNDVKFFTSVKSSEAMRKRRERQPEGSSHLSENLRHPSRKRSSRRSSHWLSFFSVRFIAFSRKVIVYRSPHGRS